MSESTTNSKKSFEGLLKGVIATTIITFAMVLVLIILIFTVGMTTDSEGGVMALSGITLAFAIIEIVCDIAWIVCVAISLAKVSEVKQYINPTNFRIAFSIFLGLYVLFWIIGIFVPILGFFQMILLIVALIFAIMYKNKLK